MLCWEIAMEDRHPALWVALHIVGALVFIVALGAICGVIALLWGLALTPFG